MFGIGILGCGKIAQVRHIPEYAANPACALRGYYNPTTEKAEAMAEKYGGKVYQTPEELLDDPAIDAVSICTANCSHARLAVAAMEAGKHVLCEKPMAVSMEECEAMAAAAERTGKFLMIAQNQRLAPAHLAAKQLLRDGAVGRVLTFRTAFGHSGPENWSSTPGKDTWFFDKERAFLGAMADLGIHKTDLIQDLLGQRVTAVSARLTTLDKCTLSGEKIPVEDNAVCIYEMSGGALGTMTASWTYYGAEDNATVIYGTDGILKIYEDPAHPLVLVHPDGTKEYFETGAIQTNRSQTASGIIDLWLDCLKTGTPPEISGEAALAAMRAVFAAVQSSAEGRRIEIPENRTE